MKRLAEARTVRQVFFGVAGVGDAILVQMRRPGYRYCHVELFDLLSKINKFKQQQQHQLNQTAQFNQF